MVNIYSHHIFTSKRRKYLSFSVLAAFALSSCTPREDCAVINAAIADGNLRIQEIYEGNRGGPGYNQGIERQVGRVYFDVSQMMDGLQLSDRQLQSVQFKLVEAYQQASDYRYEAAEIISNNPNPNAKLEADIRQLQLDPEANIGSVITNLRRRCPLR